MTLRNFKGAEMSAFLRTALISALTAVIAAIAIAQDAVTAATTECKDRQELGEDIECLSGMIDEVMFSALLSSDPPKTLVIVEVPGGYVTEALKISEWIDKNEISVEISGVCLSACANYLLFADPEVTINRSAFITVHGWPRPLSVNDEARVCRNRMEDDLGECIERLRQRRDAESQLFAKRPDAKRLRNYFYGLVARSKSASESNCLKKRTCRAEVQINEQNAKAMKILGQATFIGSEPAPDMTCRVWSNRWFLSVSGECEL